MVLKLATGKFKGKILASSDIAKELRPTQAKVREAIINIITSLFLKSKGSVYKSFEALRVLDLFSGTGSMGFEFLSNGIKAMTYIEYDPKCIRLLKENSKKLNIQDKVKILKASLPGALKRLRGQTYDLVFFDPPFKISPNDYYNCIEVLLEQNLVPEQGLLITEYKNFELEKLISSKAASRLDLMKSKDYGDCAVSFFVFKKISTN